MELKPCDDMRDVIGYDGKYIVDESGAIYNRRGKRLKPYDNGYGYLIVDLRDSEGRKRHKKVHRIVAEAFIDNSNGSPEVNHKDENKYNNAASNLEWCTSSYNKRYGTGRDSRSNGMKRVWKIRRANDGCTDVT